MKKIKVNMFFSLFYGLRPDGVPSASRRQIEHHLRVYTIPLIQNKTILRNFFC